MIPKPFTLSPEGYEKLCQTARLRGVDTNNPQHLEQFILYKCGVPGTRHPPIKQAWWEAIQNGA